MFVNDGTCVELYCGSVLYYVNLRKLNMSLNRLGMWGFVDVTSYELKKFLTFENLYNHDFLNGVSKHSVLFEDDTLLA